MANLPPLARLANTFLNGELDNFLREHRSQGDSWDTIAKKLWLATEQRVDVNGNTLAGWFDRLEVEVG